ncbi:MAG: tetratricopeptide repeat protein [Acidobacteria bacterium]|nr:tetratricopeptide repeat protein [Acidobacteriota bacterium]
MSIFRANVIAFPDSWIAWDDLAQACLRNEEYRLAARYYRRSLDLNPHNENARHMIAQIESRLDDENDSGPKDLGRQDTDTPARC